jgi:hypothetical protein
MNIVDAVHFPQLASLRKHITTHSYVAGGCFKDIFNGRRPKDIDIYFADDYQFKKAEMLYRGDGDYTFAYESDNVVAFHDTEEDVIIELVKNRYGSPTDILDSFDFTICKFIFYLTETEERVQYSQHFFQHLHLHQLVCDNKIDYPVDTLCRAFRFAQRGYSLDYLELSKILQCLLESVDVEGQLRTLEKKYYAP